MSNVVANKIVSCRICSSSSIEEVLRLQDMPFTDEFISLKNSGNEYLSNIEIGICNSCGSVQNLNDTDMDNYYNDYTYSVQSSGFAMSFMNSLAKKIKHNFCSDVVNPTILEIGSGSGEQLLEFQKLGFKVLGIEPSEKLSEFANSIGVKTLTAFFDENTSKIVDPEFSEIDVVISSYTFDHIPRPVEVLQNIYNILAPNGLIVLEVHNLELIKQRNEFCLFEHEHYTYLNESTLESLLQRNGFEVLTFDILSESEKRANSLLVVARKVENIGVKSVVDVTSEVAEIKSLSANIYESIERLEEWLDSNKEKTIVAYGAGGRGIMTIAALRNPEIFSFIVDKNPKAANIYAPKSHLPVFSLDVLGDKRADVIVVFSFGYFDEIVAELVGKFGYTKNQFISILSILKK
jgi:SAM-dependent methyltransferase